METPTLPRSKWARRGRLIWFGLVIGLGLTLQLLSELFFKGLGVGESPAVNSLGFTRFIVFASVVLTFAGLVWSGFWRVVRAAGYAAIFHILMTGWIWLTISTVSYGQNLWLNENPRSAGILTLAAGALLLIAMRLISVRAVARP